MCSAFGERDIALAKCGLFYFLIHLQICADRIFGLLYNRLKFKL